MKTHPESCRLRTWPWEIRREIDGFCFFRKVLRLAFCPAFLLSIVAIFYHFYYWISTGKRAIKAGGLSTPPAF